METLAPEGRLAEAEARMLLVIANDPTQPFLHQRLERCTLELRQALSLG
jgi:hypothetical protein